MAVLCSVTFVAGLVSLGNPAEEAATAIRVGSAARTSPLAGGAPSPQTAAAASAGAVSAEVPARATTSTVRPVAAAPAAANPLTPLTTLLGKVVPPAVAVAGALRTDSGVASWFNAPDATCAHRTLPMGTIVKVTRNHNGASTTCKVNDRGPTLETGRLIDLSMDTFEKLAATEAGLIDVRIEW